MNKLRSGQKIPLYVQIQQIIAEDIRNGDLKPGQAIPTETVLSDRYSVSRATVRQAVTELVHQGLLVRQQGRGTFVNKPKIETKLRNLYSFSQDMIERGLNPEHRIIEFEWVLPKPAIQEKLDLDEGEPVIKLVRLRLVDGELIMLETTFLPQRHFGRLTQEEVQQTKSLYSLFEEKYEIKMDHVVDYFEPVLVDDFASRMLDVPVGAPALYIERIGYLNNNSRVELSQSIVRGDRCRYFVELFRV
ncbi:GntR family transcriptional regulator [Paenibacillus nasutitermitis]|uniref:GntR family transcriptional regulator n=1 Tax=Paenibacillus nasutitermitis TaxID=1652958 RepID=A0A916ZCQ0_9BACL|nr:GntR family transcriptional regulator [Paenibacillus nasutitermitis]GGD87014.1 GntR family transcriptional regulator [Paenibacillus nasutitermitis]